MTGQEAVEKLHAAIDDTTIFYYDESRDAAHGLLDALVAERDRYRDALDSAYDLIDDWLKGRAIMLPNNWDAFRAELRAALAVSTP